MGNPTKKKVWEVLSTTPEEYAELERQRRMEYILNSIRDRQKKHQAKEWLKQNNAIK